MERSTRGESPSLSTLLAGGPAHPGSSCSPPQSPGRRPSSTALEADSLAVQPRAGGSGRAGADVDNTADELSTVGDACRPASPSLSEILRAQAGGAVAPSAVGEPGACREEGASSGRRVCSGRDAEGRGALRVRFAGGPLGGAYGTDDGHPPEEGRVATAKRDLGGGGPEGFTWHNVRTLAKLLGDDCLPSIERLKRRLKVMEAGDSPAKASNKAGERGKAAAAPKGRHSSVKRAKS